MKSEVSKVSEAQPAQRSLSSGQQRKSPNYTRSMYIHRYIGQIVKSEETCSLVNIPYIPFIKRFRGAILAFASQSKTRPRIGNLLAFLFITQKFNRKSFGDTILISVFLELLKNQHQRLNQLLSRIQLASLKRDLKVSSAILDAIRQQN